MLQVTDGAVGLVWGRKACACWGEDT
jgi:hypothetical protein